MSRTIKLLISGLVLISAIQQASANDSSAEIATGGLVFVKNPSVEMESEDLYISSIEIRVRYRFLNKSHLDVATVVAFPLPDITADPVESLIVPTNDPVNLVGFVTTADGRPVQASVEQKAYLKGVDQTQTLIRLSIPLAPHLDGTLKVLNGLARDQKKELERLGLITLEGPIGEETPFPRWTLKTTFYWNQKFAADRETIIEHRYKPSVGSSVGTNLGFKESQPQYEKYCIAPSLLHSIEHAVAGPQGAAAFAEKRIEYILTTGANWAGPIRNFRLVVNKAKPANIVSFCGNLIRKVSPTEFEMTAIDFVPAENLSILILEPNMDRAEPEKSSYYFVGNTRPPDAYLTLRTQPSFTRGQRITTMPNGTLLEVIQRRSDGWWHVRLVNSGQEGWAVSGQGDRVWIYCCRAR